MVAGLNYNKNFSARFTREVLLLSRIFKILNLKEYQLFFFKLFIFIPIPCQENPIIKPIEVIQKSEIMQTMSLTTEHSIRHIVCLIYSHSKAQGLHGLVQTQEVRTVPRPLHYA